MLGLPKNRKPPPDLNELVPITGIIRLCQEQGIDLGQGNPNHRIRYYIKNGLLPRAIRKNDKRIKQVPGKPSSTCGHLPLEVLSTLRKIQDLKDKGRSTQEIKKLLNQEKDSTPFLFSSLLKIGGALILSLVLPPALIAASYFLFPQQTSNFFTRTIRIPQFATDFLSKGGVGKSPVAKLDVAGYLNIDNQLNIGGSWAQIQSNTNINLELKAQGTGDIVFSPGGSEKARITNDGNFGIGTANPSQPLDIYSSSSLAQMRLKGVGNTYQYVNLNLASDEATDKTWFLSHRQDNPNELWIAYTPDNVTYYSPFKIQPKVPNNTLFLHSSGNIGLGTTLPLRRLDLGKLGTYGTLSDKVGLVLRHADDSDTAGQSSIGIELAFRSADYSNTNKKAIIRAYRENDWANNVGLVFLTANNAAPEERMRIMGTGNIGIGVTNTSAKLDVAGYVNIDNQLNIGGSWAQIQSDSNVNLALKAQGTGDIVFSPGGEEKARITDGGRLGIGTTTPATTLDVNGAITGSQYIYLTATDNNIKATATNGKLGLLGSGTGEVYFNYGQGGDLIYYGGGTTALMIFKTSGNVGIGTTSPSYKLDVNGSLGVGGTAYFASNVGIGTTAPLRRLDLGKLGTYGTLSNEVGLVLRHADDSDTAGESSIGLELAFRSADYADTNKKAIVRAVRENDWANNVGLAFLTANSAAPTEKMRITGTGNVGIGTTSPLSVFNVSHATAPTLTLERNDTTVTAGEELGSLDFYSRDSSTNLAGIVGRIRTLAVTDFSGSSSPAGANTAIVFQPNTGNAGSLAEAMRINYDGSVGIGTTNPGVKLEVAGNIKTNLGSAAGYFTCKDVSGTTGVTLSVCNGSAAQSDIAEFVVAPGTEAGDILEIDSVAPSQDDKPLNERNVFARPAQAPYSPNLVGIVSTWGLKFDNTASNQPGAQPMAISGILPVKVSGFNGPIKKGNSITSSSVPGVGMRATKAGPIIAKALEDYIPHDPQEVGKILALLSPTWHNPTLYLTSRGDLIQDQRLSNNELRGNEATQSATPVAQPDLTEVFARLDFLASRLELLQGTVLASATSSSVLTETSAANFLFLQTKPLDFWGEVATFSGSLRVLGKTLLSDLGLTGKITVGLLSIDGLNPSADSEQGKASINTLSGNLYLQNNNLGGIDILAGKVTIDKEGNLFTQGELTAKKINIANPGGESASMGSGTLIKGGTLVEIRTTTVTANSRIFLTPTSKTGKQPLVVSAKTEGIGFTASIEEPYSQEITFDWWVVN